MNKIKFSIIIPVKELNDYLEESIPKIFEMDYRKFEIIILPNEMPETFPSYTKNNRVRLIPTGKVSPAVKRDIGAKEAQGEYVAFMDDDAFPEKDWLSVAQKEFEDTKAAAVCGPAMTPENSSFFQKASGLFFETIFGAGGTSYREKPAKKSFYVDDYISVNLIVKKDVFLEVGGFNSEFWPGEDTKFCLDLVNAGHKIWYSNKLLVYHHRRKNLKSHLKQVGNYGKHRGYFAGKFEKTSFRPTYFAPTVFMIGNIGLFALGFSYSIFWYLWSSLLLFYFLLVCFDTARLTKDRKLWLATVGLTFISHLTYGWKFFVGFLMGLFRRKLKSELR